MAVRNKFNDEQEQLFEKELLQVLRRDPEHQFAFDGKLRVWSSRYNCELRAVSVHWDPERGDIVFVGAFMSGELQFDVSKGYPVVKPELSIPFRECFNDLKSTPGFDEGYLISKTRKAVLDKCVAYPMRLLDANGAVRNGAVALQDFETRPVYLNNGSVELGNVSCRDGVVTLESENGVPLNISKMSLRDIQRIGDSLLEVNEVIREARRLFIKGKNAVTPSLSTTMSERDVRVGEEAGLAEIYGHGYPLRYCDAVAKTYSSSYKDVFDERLHSPRDIDNMIRKYRDGGKQFGFGNNRSNGVDL